MEVIVAKSAGFCFGVKRAVDTVYDELGKNNKIYTYGPIIHNEFVVSDLESKGVTVIDDSLLKCDSNQNYDELSDATVIIRSHGVPKSVCDSFDKRGIKYVDATCPFVKKIHRIVAKAHENGEKIVIVGNENHPEVIGIKGWCEGEATVIETVDEALAYTPEENERTCVVSQTTFNRNKFQELVEILRKNCYYINVAWTICNATEERQNEAASIAGKVDAMIVIGGKESSNSRKLFEICSNECPNTYFIQTLEDLHLDLPKAANLVGITAGASTPNNIIEEVQDYVRINF